MRLRTLALAVVAALLSSAALTVPARAQIEVDINRGDVKPLPIAIPAFGGAESLNVAAAAAALCMELARQGR